MVDFEYVGIWNPSLDLWRFLISLNDDMRKKYEKPFLEHYFKTLKTFSRVPQDFTYEKCLEELNTQGIARALTWLAIVWKVRGMGAWVWLAGKIERYLLDHNIDPQTIPHPAYGFV